MEKGYAVVTGGGRGIGKALVIQLAKEGYNVLVDYYTSEEGAHEVVKTITSEYGVKAAAFKADVRDYSQVKAMRDFAISTFGDKLDVFVNNSGTASGKVFLDCTMEEYTNIINIDLLGMMHCCHVFAPLMAKHKSGNIVNITSSSGLRPSYKQCDYGTAKAGVIGLTRSLALELGEHGINVNAIAPGFINTEKSMQYVGPELMAQLKKMSPLGLTGTVEDIQQILSCVIKAPFLTGQTIAVNGGTFMH